MYFIGRLELKDENKREPVIQERSLYEEIKKFIETYGSKHFVGFTYGTDAPVKVTEPHLRYLTYRQIDVFSQLKDEMLTLRWMEIKNVSNRVIDKILHCTYSDEGIHFNGLGIVTYRLDNNSKLENVTINQNMISCIHTWYIKLDKPLKPDETIKIFIKFKNTLPNSYYSSNGNLSLLANDNNVDKVDFGCVIDLPIDLNVYIERFNNDLSTEEIEIPFKKTTLENCDFINEYVPKSLLKKQLYLFNLENPIGLGHALNIR